MRNKALASVLVLCASTAAVAHVSTAPVIQDVPSVAQDVPNNTAEPTQTEQYPSDDTLTNGTTTDPLAPDATVPDATTTDEPTMDPLAPVDPTEPTEPGLDDDLNEPMDDAPPTR